MSFGSAYPPGVSGMEYEISGPTYEETESKDCDNERAMFIPATSVRDTLADLKRRLSESARHAPPPGHVQDSTFKDGMESGAYGVNQAMDSLLVEQVEMPCEFSGEVTVQGYRDEKWWTCPRCAAEHTEMVEEEEGPDDERI